MLISKFTAMFIAISTFTTPGLLGNTPNFSSENTISGSKMDYLNPEEVFNAFEPKLANFMRAKSHLRFNT